MSAASATAGVATTADIVIRPPAIAGVASRDAGMVVGRSGLVAVAVPSRGPLDETPRRGPSGATAVADLSTVVRSTAQLVAGSATTA